MLLVGNRRKSSELAENALKDIIYRGRFLKGKRQKNSAQDRFASLHFRPGLPYINYENLNNYQIFVYKRNDQAHIHKDNTEAHDNDNFS